uniref:Uncharacterized protein n=1 Tax=Timema monikensis TaxID=170555 RepID=A0A7R9HSE2_9NEOP|nr:unnamed protein product [Timema monikensis]
MTIETGGAGEDPANKQAFVSKKLAAVECAKNKEIIITCGVKVILQGTDRSVPPCDHGTSTLILSDPCAFFFPIRAMVLITLAWLINSTSSPLSYSSQPMAPFSIFCSSKSSTSSLSGNNVSIRRPVDSSQLVVVLPSLFLNVESIDGGFIFPEAILKGIPQDLFCSSSLTHLVAPHNQLDPDTSGIFFGFFLPLHKATVVCHFKAYTNPGRLPPFITGMDFLIASCRDLTNSLALVFTLSPIPTGLGSISSLLNFSQSALLMSYFLCIPTSFPSATLLTARSKTIGLWSLIVEFSTTLQLPTMAINSTLQRVTSMLVDASAPPTYVWGWGGVIWLAYNLEPVPLDEFLQGTPFSTGPSSGISSIPPDCYIMTMPHGRLGISVGSLPPQPCPAQFHTSYPLVTKLCNLDHLNIPVEDDYCTHWYFPTGDNSSNHRHAQHNHISDSLTNIKKTVNPRVGNHATLQSMLRSSQMGEAQECRMPSEVSSLFGKDGGIVHLLVGLDSAVVEWMVPDQPSPAGNPVSRESNKLNHRLPAIQSHERVTGLDQRLLATQSHERVTISQESNKLRPSPAGNPVSRESNKLDHHLLAIQSHERVTSLDQRLLATQSHERVTTESLNNAQVDVTPVPVTVNCVKQTMDSSSGQLSTSPVLKTLNSLNSNEQNSSFNVSLTSYNMEQELLNKNNGQHSSFSVPLLFNNVKQELLNKNNGQHSSFPAPLSFNIIKEEILANDNEEHLWFPVPSTFNHVKQELIINFNEQLPSQTVPGPLTSTSAPGIEVLNHRTSDSSSNVQPLCDMECTSNESSPYSGLSYKNSLGYISAEDSPPTGQEECYKPPSGKNVSPLSCTIAMLSYAEAGSIVNNNTAETCHIAQENHAIPETDQTESKGRGTWSMH